MKGFDFINKLQDNEISSGTHTPETCKKTIKDNDNIQLIANRIYVNDKLEGNYHKE